MISEAAKRYGEGLFELAIETSTVENKKEQMENLLEVLEESDDLTTFFRAVMVSREEKIQFIEDTFKDVFDHDMCNFLKLLVDKDRTYYLKEISEAFIAMCNDYLGIERAVVFSARPLAAEDAAKIKDALEKKTGKKIVLKNKKDPKLIAGIKVQTGNSIMDISVQKKIEDMKHEILKGGLA